MQPSEEAIATLTELADQVSGVSIHPGMVNFHFQDGSVMHVRPESCAAYRPALEKMGLASILPAVAESTDWLVSLDRISDEMRARVAKRKAERA